MINSTLAATWAALKTNAGTFFAMCLGLLAPIQPILILVFAFIMLDTAFGVWAAKKTGQKVSSRRLSAFIGKIIVYAGAVILTFALDKLLLGEFLMSIISIDLLATKVTAIALILNEIWSVDEKLKNVKGKGLWHYFKRVVFVAKLIKKEAKELKGDDE